MGTIKLDSTGQIQIDDLTLPQRPDEDMAEMIRQVFGPLFGQLMQRELLSFLITRETEEIRSLPEWDPNSRVFQVSTGIYLTIEEWSGYHVRIDLGNGRIMEV